MVVLDLCCCTGFSLVVVSEAYSLFSVLRLRIAALGAQASHCCGFYCWGAWASTVQVSRLQSKGSTVVVHGLSCSEVSGIFLDQGSNLCLLHWQADSLPLSHKGRPDSLSSNNPLPHCLLIDITHLISGFTETQVPDISLQEEFSER